MIDATGNATKDIGLITGELNRLNSSDALTNDMKIVSYGAATFDVPNTPGASWTLTLRHGLSYAPVYLIKLVGSDNLARDFPFAVSVYNYSTGPKAQGGYPFNRFLTYADINNIYVEIDNLSNPGSFVESGIFEVSYYIFNRPIVS